jgi:hypothetical protein
LNNRVSQEEILDKLRDASIPTEENSRLDNPYTEYSAPNTGSRDRFKPMKKKFRKWHQRAKEFGKRLKEWFKKFKERLLRFFRKSKVHPVPMSENLHNVIPENISVNTEKLHH